MRGCRRRLGALALATLTFGATTSACSSGVKVGAHGHGAVSVAYAGSLLNLEEKVIGPGFTKSTGYKYSGRGAGALALSQEIASGEIKPNVFLSVGAKPITALEPKFTSWYVQFAASPVVIAYSQTSKFAPEMDAIAAGQRPPSDLFTMMQQPGFRLGRTDPNVDPQGQAFVEMMQLAKRQFGLAAGSLEKILGGLPSAANSPEIFDETALEPRLEAGQLDAASAYLSQAVQLHLKYIDLGPSLDLGDPSLAADYAQASFSLASGKVVKGQPLVIDITAIGAPDQAADAFIAYTLSQAGRRQFAQAGYKLLTPTVSGSRSVVPSAVLRQLG